MDDIKRAVERIEESGLFDREWYLREYPDVVALRIDPIEHYVRWGAAMGRDPSPAFRIADHVRSDHGVVPPLKPAAVPSKPPVTPRGGSGATPAKGAKPATPGAVVTPKLSPVPSEPPPDLFAWRSAETSTALVAVLYCRSEACIGKAAALVRNARVALDVVLLTVGSSCDVTRVQPDADRLALTLRYPAHFGSAAALVHLVNSGSLSRYRAVLFADLSEVGVETFVPDAPADHIGISCAQSTTFLALGSAENGRLLRTYLSRLGRDLPSQDFPVPVAAVMWIHRLLVMQMAAIPVDPNDLFLVGNGDHGPSRTVISALCGALAFEGAMEVQTGFSQAQTVGSSAVSVARTVKAIAFYLPQFHPIPENDRWWGCGFTEWSNVVKAKPLFRHHYQPRLPSDLGYYDLRNVETQEAQASLAAEHGVHGFCYYYYWFDGKKLLNTPIERMLLSGRPNHPFCVCWANENWSRNWDGQNRHVLLEQTYSMESNIALMREWIPMLKDPRYIRHKGMPVVLVYRISIIPNWDETVHRWREECRLAGVGEIHLCAVRFGLEPLMDQPSAHGLDAYVLFPPHETRREKPRKDVIDLRVGFGGEIFQYDAVVEGDVERFAEQYPWPVHRGVMMGWDNTARRSTAARIFVGATPLRFRSWLSSVVEQEGRLNRDSESLLFVNAWNEWAEGTTLEPDQRFGKGYLEAIRSVIGDLAPPPLQSRPRGPVALARDPPRWHQGRIALRPQAPTILLCAHVSGHQLFGGERSFLDVLCALEELGFNVIVTLPSGNNAEYVTAARERSQGVYVLAYPQWSGAHRPDPLVMLNFCDLIAAHGVSVVYVNTIVLVEPLQAARRMGCKGVVHARELITLDQALCRQIRLPAEDIVREVLGRSDFVIANSRATEAVFARRDRTFYVPNAADIAALDLPNNLDANGVIRFGIVSSNIPKKGLADFVEVARACVNNLPQAEFVVIGPDNPLIQGWRKDLAAGRLPSNLRLLGYRDSPREAMAEIDVLLNLSNFAESFGRTVAEALAARRPVIAYEWGALPELVQHGVNGYLAPFRDVGAVVDFVRKLAADVGLIRDMGKLGRERIVEGFSSASLARHLKTAMRQIVGTEHQVRAAAVGTTVVIPVFNAPEAVDRCLASVMRHTPLNGVRILIIDDGSSDERIPALLGRYAGQARVTLLRNEQNIGYTRTVNRGLAWAGEDDVVLLNSDTIVTPSWLAGLRVAAYAHESVGTVTAMSDNAGAFSFPEQGRMNAKPPRMTHDNYALEVVRSAASCAPVEVPTGSGFCMFVRRALVQAIGNFDEQAFPRGYGEENDFCMRAMAAGWKNVITPWAFVYHERSASFGSEKARLVEAGVGVVTRRYPDYARRVREAFGAPSMLALRRAVADAVR